MVGGFDVNRGVETKLDNKYVNIKEDDMEGEYVSDEFEQLLRHSRKGKVSHDHGSITERCRLQYELESEVRSIVYGPPRDFP